MYFRNVGAIAGALVATLSLACASQSSNTAHKSDTAAQLRRGEAAPDPTREARQRLDELNDAIIILSVKVQDYGDATQQAEWGEWLAQLKHIRSLLDAELVAARDTTAEDWAARYATLEEQLQGFESVIAQTATAIVEDLAAGPRSAQGEPAEAPAEIDLCELQVKGSSAEVRQEGELVILQITATDPRAVEELQGRVHEMLGDEEAGKPAAPAASAPDSPRKGGAKSGGAQQKKSTAQQKKGAAQSESAAAESAAGGVQPVELQVSDIDDGVVFIFAPVEGELGQLKARLEEAAEQLDARRC